MKLRILGICFVFLALAALVDGADLWDESFFTSDPAALIKAVSAVSAPDDAAVQVLLDETSVSFSAEGNRTTRTRMVYRILKEAGVESWSTTEAEWSPWNEQRPEIRVRVVSSDGTAHLLDPATIDDAPAEDVYEDVYTDRRVSQAPLPAVAVGAVVEEETLVRETRPLFDRGVVDREVFGQYVPVRRGRLVLDTPAELSLRYVTQLLGDLQPQRTEKEGRVRLVFEKELLEPLKTVPAYEPPEIPRWPAVTYATGKSWGEVAQGYSEIVDRQLASGDLSRLVKSVGAVKDHGVLIAKLLAQLHRDVRYTGVEFGDATIVPWPPGETLKRKYGDCKDQASLLVGLLRAAQIPAHVALLRAGPGPDVAADLPGMGLFTHAIVYVPSEPPVWIDPTDPFSRAGELPPGDQGRHALVADSTSTGLVLTPVSKSNDNRIVETREFVLAESGPSRVIETTEMWGTIESDERSRYDGVEEKENRESLEEYVESEYLASKLDRFEVMNPADLTKPFRTRLEISGAKRGSTDENEAVVAIFPSQMSNYLPYLLRNDPGDEDRKSEKPAEKRTVDLLLNEPYVYELRYHIVPPPGYVPKPLPTTETVSIGPATLRKEFSSDGAGVSVSMRFDTVKNRYTPDEIEAIQKKWSEIEGAGAILVRFESVGMSDLASGRIKEALAEFEKLRDLHPKEGLHYAQMARCLLAGGLGQAAREQAQKAISVDLNSAYAHRTAAWVYQHDLIGRRFLKGFNRAAAIAEYRKTLELDPEDTTAGADLAILLEHNEKGERYAADAGMQEAIAEYRKIEKELADTGLKNNLPIALMWARKFDDLKAWARKEEAGTVRNQMLLISVAATEGESAALLESKSIAEPVERRTALQNAASLLMQLRLYTQSAALMQEAALGSPNAPALRPLIDAMRKIQPHEKLVFRDEDPVEFTKKVVVRSLLASVDEKPEPVRELLARDLLSSMDEEGFESFLSIMRAAKNSISAASLPLDVGIDLALAIMEADVDGARAAGWRVRMHSGSRDSVFYLISENGKCRLLANDYTLSLSGKHILALVQAGDLAGARQWLDWAREEYTLTGGEDPFSGVPFPRFWKKGQEGDSNQIRLAAAALLSSGELADAAIPILTAARKTADSDPLRENIDLALMWAYSQTEKHEDVLSIAASFAEKQPDSMAIFSFQTAALRALHRWNDLKQLAEKRLSASPDDYPALRIMAETAAQTGNFAESMRMLSKLIDLGKATSMDRNEMAWYVLFEPSREPSDLQNAIETVRKSIDKSGNYANRHTLACLYAEAGNTTEALQELYQALDGRPAHSVDWYVIGRIAEQYGVTDAATTAYRLVEKPEDPAVESGSTWQLASRRLSALGLKTKKH